QFPASATHVEDRPGKILQTRKIGALFLGHPLDAAAEALLEEAVHTRGKRPRALRSRQRLSRRTSVSSLQEGQPPVLDRRAALGLRENPLYAIAELGLPPRPDFLAGPIFRLESLFEACLNDPAKFREAPDRLDHECVEGGL